MKSSNRRSPPDTGLDWHPAVKIGYWSLVIAWIAFVLSMYSDPGGILGAVSEVVFDTLTPKYVTLVLNTFSLLGAYIVTRLIVSVRIGRKSTGSELAAIALVLLISITTMGLLGARCDVYVFCSNDVLIERNCEVDSDRQGLYCQ